jgi:hypothetical protein
MPTVRTVGFFLNRPPGRGDDKGAFFDLSIFPHPVRQIGRASSEPIPGPGSLPKEAICA